MFITMTKSIVKYKSNSLAWRKENESSTHLKELTGFAPSTQAPSTQVPRNCSSRKLQ